MKRQVAGSPSVTEGQGARVTGNSPRTGILARSVSTSSPNTEKRSSHWSPSANRVYGSPYSQRLTASNHRTLVHGLSGRNSADSAEKKITSDKKKKEKSPSLNPVLKSPTTPTANSSIDGNDMVDRICPSGSESLGINAEVNIEINQQSHNKSSKNTENTPKTVVRKMKEHQRAQDGMILMLKGEINRKKQLLTSTQDKTNAVNNELELCEDKIIDLNHEIEVLKGQLKQSNGEISLLKFQIKKTSPSECPESIEVLKNQLDVSIELNKRLEAQMKSWLAEQIKLHQLLAAKEVQYRDQPNADKIECKSAAPAIDGNTESLNVFVNVTAVKPNAPSNIESSPRVFRDLFSGLCSTFDEAPTKVVEVLTSKPSIAELSPFENSVGSASDIIEVESGIDDAFVYDRAKRKPFNYIEDKENVYSRPNSSTSSSCAKYKNNHSAITKAVMTPNSLFIEQLNRVKEENNSIKNDIMKFRGRLKVLQLDI